MKKTFGILFFVLFALGLVGQIANGTLRHAFLLMGENAIANLIGMVLGWALYIGCGIFFFVLDASDRKSIHEAIKARKKLTPWAIVFMAVIGILTVVTARTAGENYAEYAFYFDDISIMAILNIFGGTLLSLVCLLIFVSAFIMWFYPFLRVRTALMGFNVEDLAYMNFEPLGSSKNIYVNPHAILFRKQLIIIPINQIAAVREKIVVVEHDIVFTFTNGKKMEIVSTEFPALNAYLANLQRIGQ